MIIWFFDSNQHDTFFKKDPVTKTLNLETLKQETKLKKLVTSLFSQVPVSISIVAIFLIKSSSINWWFSFSPDQSLSPKNSKTMKIKSNTVLMLSSFLIIPVDILSTFIFYLVDVFLV